MISKLIINGNTITDPRSLVNEFNKKNCSVDADLASKLPATNYNNSFQNFMPPSIPNSFVCDTISIKEIENTIKKIKSKNSSGPDLFNAKFILEFSKHLIQPLHYIYNLSVSSSVYPFLFKTAKVIPIYKKRENILLLEIIVLFCF